jgi:hypothetical protein
MKEIFNAGLIALFLTSPVYAEEVEEVEEKKESAIKFNPRIGLNIGQYALETDFQGESEDLAIGPEIGLNISFGSSFFVDFLVNTYAAETFTDDQTSINAQELEDGWVNEYAITGGVDVYKSSVYFIAGYRYATYGDSIFGDEAAEQYGPFIGLAFPNLKFTNSEDDLLSLSIAIQSSEVEVRKTINGNSVDESSDLAANIKITYRKKNSPHSIGMKYNVFGGDQFAEYIVTGNYTYTFGVE